MSSTILEAVLRYTARCRADQLWPQYWSTMRDCFDNLLLVIWQRAQARRLSRVQFLRAWRAELALFFNMEVAAALMAAADDGLPPIAKDVEALVGGSLIGAELFSPEAMLSDLSTFKTDSFVDFKKSNFNMSPRTSSRPFARCAKGTRNHWMMSFGQLWIAAARSCST